MNWVKARADCTIEDTLGKLVGRIKSDVRLFNGLDEKKRRKRYFKVKDNEESYSVLRAQKLDVVPRQGDPYPVDLRYRHLGITIGVAQECIVAQYCPTETNEPIEIESRWNKEELACDLFIKGEKYTIPQISQLIIGDFLFEGI